MAKTAVATALLGGFVACGSDFDPSSRITSLRVLAVIADKPYAHPGDTVNLTMTYFDPFASTRKVTTFAWAACVDPADPSAIGCLEAIAEAAGASGQNPLTSGGGVIQTSNEGFSYSVPSTVLDGISEAARPNAIVGIISIVCPGTLGFDPTQNLATGQLPITCTDPTTSNVLPLSDWQIGIKRIFLRETDRNANPVFADDGITWDGKPWDASTIQTVTACSDYNGNRFDRCDNSLAHHLAATVTPESFESGVDEFGNPFTEQVIIEYYATEGIFDDDVREAQTPDTQWVAREQSIGQTVTMWMVAHDDRGGAAITQRTVQVNPKTD